MNSLVKKQIVIEHIKKDVEIFLRCNREYNELMMIDKIDDFVYSGIGIKTMYNY